MFPNGRYEIYCQVLQYIQGIKHLFNRRNASIELTHRPPENLELTNGYGTMAQQNASYLSCMRCNIGTCICICKRIKIFTIVPSLCDFTILNLVSSKGQRPALVLIEKTGFENWTQLGWNVEARKSWLRQNGRQSSLWSGLPDFSWHNIPKREKIYQLLLT
jgi:hypothetical protein